MFLQTLVQLNLLILATPALAGWALLPLAQPGVARACVVAQGRTAEAALSNAAPVEAVRTLRAAPAQLAVRPAQAVTDTSPAADQTVRYVVAVPPAVVSSHPFPHAARAP